MKTISAQMDFQVPGTKIVVEKNDKIRVRTKKKTEAQVPIISFGTSRDSTSFTRKEEDELFDITHNGVMLDSESASENELPTAWDAAMTIEGPNLVIEGGAGSSGYGEVTIKVPKIRNAYRFILEPKTEKDHSRCLQILAAHSFNF